MRCRRRLNHRLRRPSPSPSRACKNRKLFGYCRDSFRSACVVLNDSENGELLATFMIMIETLAIILTGRLELGTL